MKIKEFSQIYGVKEDTIRAYIRRNKSKFPNVLSEPRGYIDLDESACKILAAKYKTKEKKSQEFEKLRKAMLIMDHNMHCVNDNCSNLEKQNENIQKYIKSEITDLKREIRRLNEKIIELELEKKQQNEKNTLINKIFK